MSSSFLSLPLTQSLFQSEATLRTKGDGTISFYNNMPGMKEVLLSAQHWLRLCIATSDPFPEHLAFAKDAELFFNEAMEKAIHDRCKF